MAEFKLGDKVVRKEHLRNGAWELDCAKNDHAADEVFTVGEVMEFRIRIDGLPGHWGADSFRLATGLDEHQGVGLPAEDRLRESDAHIECLRDLLDIEKCRVSELQAEVQELEARVTDINRIGVEFCDQRDAAVAAAKSLGEDLRVAREDVRWARFARAHIAGLTNALYEGTADLDLHHIANQLELVAQMCDDRGNGADATLAYNAAQVVKLVAISLSALDEVGDYAPRIFPDIEAPLA